MKKVISLLLVCLMVLPFASVTAFAAEWANTTVSDSQTIAKGETVTLTGTMTVEKGAELIIKGTLVVSTGRVENYGTITVEDGGSLTVTNGNANKTVDNAALYNEGTINIENAYADVTIATGAYAYNKGVINNVEYIHNNGREGSGLKHYVLLPADFDRDYTAAETWNREDMNVKFDVKYFMYGAGNSDLDYLDETKYTDPEKDDITDIDNVNAVWVDNSNEIFILIIPNTKGEWVDTGRMQLIVNGNVIESRTKLGNTRGVFVIKPTSAVSVQPSSTNYKDIVRLFEIDLPTEDSYYVATRQGDVNRATVEYGRALEFYVVLSPDYDMSDNVMVYINGVFAEADKYGYYQVEKVTEDITINVMGVISNEVKESVNSALSLIQEIINIIKSIFQYFLDIFNLGSLDDLGGVLGQG